MWQLLIQKKSAFKSNEAISDIYSSYNPNVDNIDAPSTPGVIYVIPSTIPRKIYFCICPMLIPILFILLNITKITPIKNDNTFIFKYFLLFFLLFSVLL